MTSSARRVSVERKPHYVYIHRATDGEIVYVGRTANPESRPRHSRGREWMTEMETTIELVGPLRFEAACQKEADLIGEHHPRFNYSAGWDRVSASNPVADRIRRECYVPKRYAIQLSERVDESDIDAEVARIKRQFWGGLAGDLDLRRAADRKEVRRRMDERTARFAIPEEA